MLNAETWKELLEGLGGRLPEAVQEEPPECREGREGHIAQAVGR